MADRAGVNVVGVRQLVPLAEQASLCHFLTTVLERESGVCSGPQRGRESSSQLGSIVGSRGRLGRHTEVFGGTAEEPKHCRHAHQPKRSPSTARWLASAPRSARSPRPGWRAAGTQRLGRQSHPSAQVEVESDRGQGVADGVQCVVRGDHAGDEGHDGQGDRKHDRSAAGHPRRRSIGPGRRPAGTIAAEVETAGGRTTPRSGTSSASRAPCGPHPTRAGPLPGARSPRYQVGRRTMLSHTVA